MAELTTNQRERLKDEQFAYLDQQGERHLPIHDPEHVRNAIQRFGQTHFENQRARQRAARKILEAAKRHRIDVSDDDVVVKAAR